MESYGSFRQVVCLLFFTLPPAGPNCICKPSICSCSAALLFSMDKFDRWCYLSYSAARVKNATITKHCSHSMCTALSGCTVNWTLLNPFLHPGVPLKTSKCPGGRKDWWSCDHCDLWSHDWEPVLLTSNCLWGAGVAYDSSVSALSAQKHWLQSNTYVGSAAFAIALMCYVDSNRLRKLLMGSPSQK